MILRKTGPESLEIHAPAKLNLYLEVLGKRPDGYHDIDTVMHTVDLYDRVEIRRTAGECGLRCFGRDAGPVSGNLALRAALLFRDRCGGTGGFDLRLEKRIPVGGGLGGGSSDGAAVLAGCNLLSGNPLRLEELRRLGAELGSDVPFFLSGGTARCLGRGELITPIHGIPSLTFVVVFPGFSIPTKRVYENLNLDLTKCKSGPSFLIERLESGRAAEINQCLFNRLEQPALIYETQLAEARRQMAGMGLLSLRMSGSGSSFFQLVEEEEISGEELEFFHKAARWDCFLVRSSPMIRP